MLTLAALNLLSVPLVCGRDAHRGPGTLWHFSEESIPRGLVDCCLYIRDHSMPGDVIQDSSDDPELKVGALSECQNFASSYRVSRPWMIPPKGLRERLDELRSFRQLDTEQAVRAFASRNHIAWFLLRPEDQVRWPVSLLDHQVYESNGYRVYYFKDSLESHGKVSIQRGRLGKYRVGAFTGKP